MAKLNNQKKRMKLRNKKALLLTIFILAIFLRIGGNIVKEKVFFHKPFLFSGDAFYKNLVDDENWYVRTARAVMDGRGISSIDLAWRRSPDGSISILQSPSANFKKIEGNYYAHKLIPPLYPLFLALCFSIGGVNTLSYFIPQVILASLTCLIIYLLTKEIFNEKVAILAGFFVAFYPDLIFWTNALRVETLFIFLLALGFWLLIKGNSRENILLIFMGAVVFGLACLTRITLIPFIPLLFLWEVLFFKKDKKRGFGIALLTVLLIILVLLPWCIRNFLVFDKFTPFTAEANTFISRHDSNNHPELNYYCQSYDSLILRALAFIKDHPKEYTLDSLKMFLTFWSPYTPPMRKIAKVYKGLTWLVIFPLAFWGMVASRRSWKKSGLLIVFIFYHALLHAGSYVDSGLVYRYPIQPFLCIFAAYGFWKLEQILKPYLVSRKIQCESE